MYLTSAIFKEQLSIGHINSLIIDQDTKIIERFEPLGKMSIYEADQKD